MIPGTLLSIANHLWQSTLFAGVAGLLALLLRRKRAQTRYVLWLVASVKFLVPFSVLVEVGDNVGHHTAAATPQGLSDAIEQVSQPFGAAVPFGNVQMANRAAADWISAALYGCWALGSATLIFSWWRRWRDIRAALLAASRVDLQGINAMSSPAFAEPGVFGIRRPVLLLPAGITNHITPLQLRAIVAHELCHIRRRDNLAGAIHMAVEALFWFHPVVWWIGARLVEEREHACDEDVLLTGIEPEAYAEGILRICELYLQSRLPCAAGVTGGNLRKRVEGIMANRALSNLTVLSKVLLAGLGVAAVAAPLLVGVLRGQSPSATRPSFEVASIKVNTMEGPGSAQWGPQEVDLTRAFLLGVISEAYEIPYSRVSAPRDSTSQGVLRANYDIAAKAAHPVPKADLLVMLQSLLEERFRMKVHHESKTADVYKLVVAKGGPHLEESTTDGPSSGAMIPGGYEVKNSEMWRFCAFLSGRMGRPVIDQTGLAGFYNFSLRLDTLEGLSSSDPDFKIKFSDWSSSSIFSDIQKQLGLQLVSGKAAVDYLVIDHVERPSQN